MSGYSGPSSVNSYWYYDALAYQPNVNVSFNTNISVNTPPHPSFDMYSGNNNNSNNSRFADSGYLSRTPTPPTPTRTCSPEPMSTRQDANNTENDSRMLEKSSIENKPRLPYVKRTRIQYTLQQLQILEEAFQNNHYPEVTTVDALAELLDVRHEKISIWFQNRRSRFKRQQKPKAVSSSLAITTGMPSLGMNDPTKKHALPMSSILTTSSSSSAMATTTAYDGSPSYYNPYLWPSPIVDNRTSTSYSGNPHISTFYDSSTSPMWNSNNNVAYLSSTEWHQSSCPTMNLSISSPSSPCSSLLPEHLSSM